MTRLIVLLLFGAVSLAPFARAEDTKAMVQQLQEQVTLLTRQIQNMQSSFDQNIAVLKDTAQKNTENLNALDTRIGTMEQALKREQANGESCADVTSQYAKALRDALDEIRGRMAQISKQLDATSGRQASFTGQPAASANPARAVPPSSAITTPPTNDSKAPQTPPKR